MKMRILQSLALQASLELGRIGWGNGLIGFLYLVVLVLWLGVIPWMENGTAARAGELERAQQALHVLASAVTPAQRTLAEVRLQHFYDALGQKRLAEQHVKTLFSIGRNAGLALNQGEYRFSFDEASGIHAYQIALPVKGTYGAIRRFCEQVLLTIPFASLDEMSFKRDSIASPALDARLRFTLYLIDMPTERREINMMAAAGRQDGKP